MLDEPFSALDSKLKNKLYTEFKSIIENLNIPVILITHNEKEAEILGDRLLYLKMEEFKLGKFLAFSFVFIML